MSSMDIVYTLGLVLLGAIAAVLQLVAEIRNDDDPRTPQNFSLRDYLGLYPYKTTVAIITALGSAAGLYAAGELTAVTAFGVGYIGQNMGRIAKK